MNWRKYGGLGLAVTLVAAMLVALFTTAVNAATPVTVGNGSSSITGVDVTRTTNALVKYTPAYGASTRTNSYGFEAAVVNGVVTQIANGVGNMAIPANGFVLSGHGTQRTFLLTYAKVGVAVTEGGIPPPPGGGTPETASKVTIGGPTNTRAITANNTRRLTNQLIRYTRAWGATTDQNQYGFEAAVLNGKITKVEDRIGNMAIPTGGYVLSGHGTEATWLRANAVVGANAVLDTDSTQPPPTSSSPPPTTSPPPTGIPSDALVPDIRVHKLDRTLSQDPSGHHGFSIVLSGGQKLLKFPAITANVGAGPLEIRGTRSSSSAIDWVGRQVVLGANGVRTTLGDTGASFYFAGDGHNHWHIRDFDKYEILDATGTTLKLGEKHGFCFEDNTTRDSTWSQLPTGPEPSSPQYPNATSCGVGQPNATSIVHGLSVGWADTYPSSLPDQAIDVTGLPDGTYTVRVTADWQGFWAETNENNNVATSVVKIAGNSVTFVSANTGL